MTILALLKQQTRLFHEALERQLRVDVRCHDLLAYRQLLICFYGFYHPIEIALARLSVLDEIGVELERRRKSPLLEHDLRTLGYSERQLAQVKRCLDLPHLTTPAAGLGCLYVLEGATLGGQIIARQLAPKLGLSQTGGVAFFTSYGRELGPMWRAFGTVLTSYVNTAPREADTVAAACATFTAFHCWIQEALP